MKYLLIVLILNVSTLSNAQVFVKDLKATDLNGNLISISAGEKRGVVVFITSTRCPYDDHYLQRFQKYAAQFQSQFEFYFLNSTPDDSAQDIKDQIKTWNTTIPYLHDLDQSVKHALNAKRTSEVFLMESQKDGRFKISYHGPVDDNPLVSEDVDRNYLLDAINAVLQGSTPHSNAARVAGCVIRDRH